MGVETLSRSLVRPNSHHRRAPIHPQTELRLQARRISVAAQLSLPLGQLSAAPGGVGSGVGGSAVQSPRSPRIAGPMAQVGAGLPPPSSCNTPRGAKGSGPPSQRAGVLPAAEGVLASSRAAVSSSGAGGPAIEPSSTAAGKAAAGAAPTAAGSAVERQAASSGVADMKGSAAVRRTPGGEVGAFGLLESWGQGALVSASRHTKKAEKRRAMRAQIRDSLGLTTRLPTAWESAVAIALR
jgi:hypothetical protein